MSDHDRLFRPINPSVGQQPSLGPIPTSILAPAASILVSFYLLFVVILHLSFGWFLLLSLWGITSWWTVVGQKPWKFTHKFQSVPNWTRGHLPYQHCLPEEFDDFHKAAPRH